MPGASASATSPDTTTCWSGATATATAKSPRSREANRLAAAKCRTKSRKKNSKLQERERCLVLENRRLVSCAQQLRDEVLNLKNEILSHSECDSDVIKAYIDSAARKVV